MESNSISDDELSLWDIVEFFKEGWKTITAITAIGFSIGAGVAFALPEKFEATAAIDPAKVLGNQVESTAVLAEKMRSPTYYSPETFTICGLSDEINPARTLTKNLSPAVAKQSAFVGIRYQAPSSQEAEKCLYQVLKDVNANQNIIAQSQITLAHSKIKKEEEKLILAEAFVAAVANKQTAFDFNDSQFSASSLLVMTLQSKQNEIVELKNSIASTRLALTEPQTKAASFATPVYAPDLRVEPKRSLIALIATFAGGCLAVVLLLTRRAYRQYTTHSRMKEGGSTA